MPRATALCCGAARTCVAFVVRCVCRGGWRQSQCRSHPEILGSASESCDLALIDSAPALCPAHHQAPGSPSMQTSQLYPLLVESSYHPTSFAIIRWLLGQSDDPQAPLQRPSGLIEAQCQLQRGLRATSRGGISAGMSLNQVHQRVLGRCGIMSDTHYQASGM
jgi:hypothetical protein